MKNNIKHMDNQDKINPDILVEISGGHITWSKSKEEIWPDLLKKIEDRVIITRNNKVVYMQLRKLAIAAIFLLVLSIPVIMYFYTKTINTNSGHETVIFLPDNSKVTIQINSTLSYKPLIWFLFRTVHFEGEASFEVKKGKKFEVVSVKGTTSVLGTQFIIYTHENKYHVTCISGKVKVEEPVHLNNAILSAGKKAVLLPEGTFEIIDLNSQEEETSGIFSNKSLNEELNQVLSVPSQQEIITKKDINKVQTEKEVEAISKVDGKENGKFREQEKINEQNLLRDQSFEERQKNEQNKLSSTGELEKKEQEGIQNKEKASENESNNVQKQSRFRASLTPAQIGILENQKMTREEKRKAFMESLTEEQRLLLKEENEGRERQKNDNLNKLNDADASKEQQKIQVREQIRQQSGKESQDQQKQQMNDNKPNQGTGTDKGSGSGSGTGNNPGNQPKK